MTDKDRLLVSAENIGKKLNKEHGSELQKMVGYLVKHDKNKGLEPLCKLLKYKPPNRGSVRQHWEKIKEVLKKEKKNLQNYQKEEVAFILGWAARIARYKPYVK